MTTALSLRPGDRLSDFFLLPLNLNDDFEGGELVFLEYAGVEVSTPPGAATVLSRSVLHQALPVTRGRRFVLTTFFRQKQ